MPNFQIELRTPQGEEPVNILPTGEPAISTDGISTHWSWDLPIPQDHGRVQVRVTRVDHGEQEIWSIQAIPTSERLGLWTIRFPIVDSGPAEQLLHIVPWNMGVERAFPTGEMRYPYPSCTAAMQFTAAYAPGKPSEPGLYLAAHDPQANYKAFLFQEVQGRGLITVEQFPEGMGQPQTAYHQPYPIVVQPITGGWYAAAQIYKEWFKPQKTRDTWANEIDAWYLLRNFSDEDLSRMEAWTEELGVKAAVHMYFWHQFPFDSNYPRYFPAKPGFTEALKRLRQAGIKSMPYTNARLWDSSDPSWEERGAAPYAVRQANGEKVTEVYASKVPLSPMCPTTPFWHEQVLDFAQTLVELGVDSVYLDQIGAAYPIPCFNPDHNHPIGGGHHWVDGYKAMMEKMHKALPQTVLTTEENADCFLHLFDSVLICNGPNHQATAGLIPLFPAVFGGFVNYWAVQYYSQRDFQSPGFRVKIARQLCWGAQIGWFEVHSPITPTDFAYFKEAVQTRNQIKRFFQDGHLLPLPKLETGTVSIPIEKDQEVQVHAITVGRWGLGGEELVLLANAADEPMPYTLTWPEKTETGVLQPREIWTQIR